MIADHSRARETRAPRKPNTGQRKKEPNTLVVKKDIVYYRYTKDRVEYKTAVNGNPSRGKKNSL